MGSNAYEIKGKEEESGRYAAENLMCVGALDYLSSEREDREEGGTESLGLENA